MKPISRFVAGAFVLALQLAARPALSARGGVPGPGDDGFATGNPRATDHCILLEIDYCEYFDVDAAFPIRLDVLAAGSFWVPTTGGWWVNLPGGTDDHPILYPPGYVSPFPDDPFADFASKIVSVRVQIDRGTSQEKNLVYADPLRMTGYSTWGDFNESDDLDPGSPGFHFNPTIMPLSIGAHQVVVYWTLSAEHCDGTSTDRDFSCLPPGEFCWRGCGGQFVFSFAPVSQLP